MAEAFKNIYNVQFTNDLKLVLPDLDAHLFVSQITDKEWENRGYKQRNRHMAIILKKFLPADYKAAVAKIIELVDHIERIQPDFAPLDDKSLV